MTAASGTRAHFFFFFDSWALELTNKAVTQ